MIKIILPFSFVLIIALSACENKPITDKACDCEGFYNKLRSEDHPFIEFQKVFTAAELGGFLNDIYLDTTLFEDSLTDISHEKYVSSFLYNIDDNNTYQNTPQIGFVREKDTSAIMHVLTKSVGIHWLKVQPPRFVWSQKKISLEGHDHQYFSLYAVNPEGSYHEDITLEDIESARLSQDPYDNSYGISLSMTDKGAEKWTAYTRDNVGNFIAILSYNHVLSSPIINGPITGGETLISGNFTKAEAIDMTNLFNCAKHFRKTGQKQFEEALKNCE